MVKGGRVISLKKGGLKTRTTYWKQILRQQKPHKTTVVLQTYGKDKR